MLKGSMVAVLHAVEKAVADGQRAHCTLLLKAPIELRAPNVWCVPHEFLGVFQALLDHGRGLEHPGLEEAAVAVSRRPLGSCWFLPDEVKAGPLRPQVQSTHSVLIWTFRRAPGWPCESLL